MLLLVNVFQLAVCYEDLTTIDNLITITCCQFTLLTAFAVDDGAVRIWKDFSSRSNELSLVTAWQALSESAASTKTSEY